MSDTQRHDGDELPFGNGELDSYESAERDGEGNLVPAPGARAAKNVNDAAANIGEEVRNKVPMGPEPKGSEAPAPVIGGDDETADKYGEGDGARDDQGNLIPGYPGDAR